MTNYIEAVFNSRGRLSQTDYAFKTVTLCNPIVAIKSKYSLDKFFFILIPLTTYLI